MVELAKTTYIGIGAQKCASTWVHRILEDHPQVFVSQPKELDFFTHNFDRGYQWYLDHFKGAGEGQLKGEISPSYFYDPLAPARAHAFNPDLKVILCLRDPIKRAYSNHLHEIRVGHFASSDVSFEAGLANNPMYMYQGLYATHMRKWLDYFPREQLLVLIQEEIQADPERHALEVYNYLGIDHDHKSDFLDRRANASHTEKYQGLDSGLKFLGRTARRIGLSSLVDQVKSTSAVQKVREANREHLSETIPPMLEETKARLKEELAEEMSDFVKLLGRQPASWNALPIETSVE